MEPPSTPFALKSSFPPVIFTYCTKTDGGRGEQRMWQIANFLKKNGIASFNGCQVKAGEDWQTKWFGKMPEAKICILILSEEYFTSKACVKECVEVAADVAPEPNERRVGGLQNAHMYMNMCMRMQMCMHMHTCMHMCMYVSTYVLCLMCWHVL